jgi:hypothetical protein
MGPREQLSVLLRHNFKKVKLTPAEERENSTVEPDIFDGETWLECEKQYLRDNWKTTNADDAAFALRRNSHAVKMMAHRLGLRK